MMTSGIVLIMTCAAFFVYEFISAHETARRHLSMLARVISSNSTAAIIFNSPADARETLASLQKEQHIRAAVLYDSTGKVFAKYPENIPSHELPTPPFEHAFDFRDSFLSGFEPVAVDGNVVGTLYLKADITEVYQRFFLYGIIAVVFIIISFVFAYFISVRLQKSITNPILELAAIARQVSEKGDYSVRAEKTTDDEVGDLTDAFNNMLQRIAQQNQEIITLNQGLEQKVKERTRELEQAILQLQKQTDFSEKIFDASIDLIAVFDTELRYVTMNSKSEGMYGKTRYEVHGKYLAELFPQTIDSGMIADLQLAMKKGDIIHRMNYRSLVTQRVYQSYYIPLKDEQGNVYSVIAIAHDITDIMQANEKLQKLNTELARSNSELEQFAYVASHDLQEPLRKIQTFAELGERNAQNPEVLKRYLEKVSSSAQRMTELIKSVLNYSRLSKYDDKFDDVDLNAVIRSICTDLELLIEEKGASIQHDPMPSIRGIKLQLHQLFLNLISNSLKFNDRKPRINITRQVQSGKEVPPQLELDPDLNYLVLQFSDNGIGFDPKFSDKIFSIFQRLHNDRNFAGTGIGLALCKKIVENHKGAISVQSIPGDGTTFFVYLPFINVESPQLMNNSSTNM